MSISTEYLVDPNVYDQHVYDLLHMVLDRVIELGAKADTSEDTEDAGDAPEDGFVNILRSQANFTPSERAEFQATGATLNMLINIAVSRRGALYTFHEDLADG